MVRTVVERKGREIRKRSVVSRTKTATGEAAGLVRKRA